MAAAAIVLGVALSFPATVAAQNVRPTVYWLGRSFDGLPLVARPKFPPGFIYERCGPSSRATCEVQVQNWLLRHNHPSQYDEELRERCVKVRVRGVPAAFIGADGLDVYTGRRTVRIFAGTRRQALRAAVALRSVRRVSPSRRNLRPPAINVSRALRGCRTLTTPLTG